MDAYKDYRESQLNPPEEEDWSRPYSWYLRGWLPAEKDARILDLGCGEGNLLAVFRKMGYENVEGLDLRQEAVEVCQRRGFQARCQDVRHALKGDSQKYDLVLAIDLLEHLTRDEIVELFVQVRGALRPNGAVVVQVPNLASPMGAGIFFGDITHQTGMTPDSLWQMMWTAGFRNGEIRQTGPGFWGLKSALRYVLWQMLCQSLRLWTLVETGSLRTGVLTRVMIGRFTVA